MMNDHQKSAVRAAVQLTEELTSFDDEAVLERVANALNYVRAALQTPDDVGAARYMGCAAEALASGRKAG